MRRTMLAAISATALSFGLVAAGSAPVLAQGVAQLQESATNSLAQLGVDTSMVDMLTLRQLQQIELVVNGTETDDEKRGQIEQIMADTGMAGGGMGAASSEAASSGGMMAMPDVSVLEESVRNNLAQLDITEEVDVSALTIGQLSQLNLVLNNSETEDEKRGQVEAILGIQ